MADSRNCKNHFRLTGRWLYIWLMVANSTSMLLFGYDQGVFGGILTLHSFEQKFGIHDNEALKGIVVGSYDLGCLFGALATVPIGGLIGRRRSVLLGSTIMMIGAFLQFLAVNYGMMTAGRVIAGIGNGMNTATAPVWASETCKTAARGKTGMALLVVNIVGLAISCWMTYIFSFVKSEAAWRFPLAFQLFFVLVIYFSAFWLPESPRWLIMKNQKEEALTIMVALEGNGATRESTVVKREFEDISQCIALEQSTQVKRETRPKFRLLLGVGAQAMQQLTGINVISYYLPYVLTESVRLPGPTARLVAAVNSMTYLASTVVGLYFIEKWGRRRLLMFGACGQIFCWLAITLLLSATGHADINSLKQRELGGVAVSFFFLFNCFFGAGWLGVSWLYPTEINSTQNRIVGMAAGVATNWLINFAVVFFTPLGIAKLGAQFYAIWCVLNALMVPIIYFFYPETAGRSLEDIDGMFEAHPSIWIFTSKAMKSRKPQGPFPSRPPNHSFELTESLGARVLQPARYQRTPLDLRRRPRSMALREEALMGEQADHLVELQERERGRSRVRRERLGMKPHGRQDIQYATTAGEPSGGSKGSGVDEDVAESNGAAMSVSDGGDITQTATDVSTLNLGKRISERRIV